VHRIPALLYPEANGALLMLYYASTHVCVDCSVARISPPPGANRNLRLGIG